VGHILNLHVHKEYSGGSFYPFFLLELESSLNHENHRVQRALIIIYKY